MFSKNSFIIAAFLLVISFGALFAQRTMGDDQPTYTIAGLSVEGNQFSDVETIIAISGLRVGDKIIPPADDKLQVAIKNLWKRKQFSDVDIIADKVSGNNVFLKIRVKEFPRMYKFLIEGNDQVKEKDIALASEKIRGDILSNYDLYLIKSKVKKLYNKEGLAFAKIDVKSVPADTGNFMNVIVTINEGVEYHVKQIVFRGNDKLSNSDLAGSFDKTHSKSWWEFWKSSKFVQEEYEKDKELLKKYMKKEGFMESALLKDSIEYNEETESVVLYLDVYEGNKYYIRNIDFNGNTVYNDELLKERLDFKTGDVYDYEKFMANLQRNEESSDALSLYMDNGFLQARMEPKEKKISNDTVDIDIAVFENDRYRVGNVIIVGNKKTKDKVIRRELYTMPGDYFDKSAIIRSVRALGVLNYFNPDALKPDVQPSNVDNTTVDIIYPVEERSTDTFNASMGFAGTYGLTWSLGITLNNFSLLEPLMGGAGQVFNFTWENGYDSKLQTFSLGFSEPWLFDEPTTLGFSLYNTKINYYYQLRRTGGILNIGRRFRWPDDYFRGDWSVKFQLNDVGSEVSSYYRQGKYTEFTLSQKYSRISLNNLFFPTVGSRFSLSADWAMGAIGVGSTDFLKTEFNMEMLNPLLSIGEQDRVVLYLSSKLGYVTGIKNDTTISPIELYYMGGNGLAGYGVTPLRGYDDRAIGSGNGAKLMAKYTAELRLALSQNPMPIFIYGFAEAGNVWDSFKGANPFELKRSAGLGIQMMINPIGIFGFSYGYGFDPVGNSDKPSGWKFLFHLGGQ